MMKKDFCKNVEQMEHVEQYSDMMIPFVYQKRKRKYTVKCTEESASEDADIPSTPLYNDRIKNDEVSKDTKRELTSDEIEWVDVSNEYEESDLKKVTSEEIEWVDVSNEYGESDLEEVVIEEAEWLDVLNKYEESELEEVTSKEIEWVDVSNEYEESDLEGVVSEYAEALLKKDKNILRTQDQDPHEIISDVKRLKEIAGAYNYAKSVMQKKEYCILSYDDSITGLYSYNGHCWQPVDKETLMNDAYSVLSEDTRNNTDSINKLCRNIADYVRLNVVYDFHEGDKAFCSEDFNTINNRIVFQNGVYDVATGEMCDFDSSLPYYMEVDCWYKEKNKRTPYYDKLKYDATGGDEDSMEMIDLMIAYLLIPNRSGKCFFIMSNAKDSGKSILGQFIESLFKGDVCQTIDPEHFSGRFAFAGAEKTALYTCLEMSTDRLSKAAVAGIKRITGERKMRVEQKYQDVKTVDIRCKLLLASNGGLYLPKNTEDDAFYRRMIVIPFIKSTPLENMIADLPQKLQKEKSAIVSNAVRKLRKYISLDGGIVFPESELSKLIKNSWMGKNLYDELFVRNELVYTGNLADKIAKSDIYLRYQQYYCSEEVRDDMPAMCSRDALIKLIKNIYPQVRDKKARCSSVEKPDNEAQPCIHGIRWCAD